MANTDRKLRVFLCHAKEDKPIVRGLYNQLTAEGWMDVWFDEEKLLPGQEWDMEIEKAVEQADVVAVCLSSHSVDKEGYVQKELRFVLNIADEKPEGAIFVTPLRLDECVVPRRLRVWQYADYFPMEERARAYQRLMSSLKIRAEKLDIPTAPQPDASQGTAAMAELLEEERRIWNSDKKMVIPPMPQASTPQTVATPVDPDRTPNSSDKKAFKKSNEKYIAEIKKNQRDIDHGRSRKGWWSLGWFLVGVSVTTMLTAIFLQSDSIFFTGIYGLCAGGLIAFFARPRLKR